MPSAVGSVHLLYAGGGAVGKGGRFDSVFRVCTIGNMVMANSHLKVLSTADVARRMGLTTASVRRFAIAGELRGRKLGARSWVFDEDDVERFIRKHDESLDPASGGRPRSEKPSKN
jgi:excisionase family DNA binding protein